MRVVVVCILAVAMLIACGGPVASLMVDAGEMLEDAGVILGADASAQAATGRIFDGECSIEESQPGAASVTFHHAELLAPGFDPRASRGNYSGWYHHVRVTID